MRGESPRQMISVSSVNTASAVASNEMRMKVARQRFHPQPEHARNFVEMQSEEIFDLRAGNQHRNAVGESNHHRPRNELHRRAQAGQRP